MILCRGSVGVRGALSGSRLVEVNGRAEKRGSGPGTEWSSARFSGMPTYQCKAACRPYYLLIMVLIHQSEQFMVVY